MIAATPALSSAPRTDDPSEYTPSSFTTGVISGVGRTVSMCAFRMIGSPFLPRAGHSPIRFPCGSDRHAIPNPSIRGLMTATTRSSSP